MAKRPDQDINDGEKNLKKCLQTYTVFRVEQKAIDMRGREFVVRVARVKIKGQQC